jgi:Fur family ferric uptake transcriptional regulator
VTTALDLARDDALDRFRAWLKARNLPVTAQRLAIARVVLGAETPLAADEVVDRLRAHGPAPGTATVYRTIDVLMQCGLVEEEDRREGFRRFVPVRDDVSADELLCTGCGAVIHAPDAALAERTEALARRHAFVAVRHRLVVYGLCASCAAAREAPRTSHLPTLR